MTRLLVLLLLVAAPLVASAAQDGSDLDRLSGTDHMLGSGTSSDADAPPLAGRVCNGVETGSTAPCPPPDAPPVPIDGGLSLLAAAGVAYAARKMRARQR